MESLHCETLKNVCLSNLVAVFFLNRVSLYRSGWPRAYCPPVCLSPWVVSLLLLVWFLVFCFWFLETVFLYAVLELTLQSRLALNSLRSPACGSPLPGLVLCTVFLASISLSVEFRHVGLTHGTEEWCFPKSHRENDMEVYKILSPSLTA